MKMMFKQDKIKIILMMQRSVIMKKLKIKEYIFKNMHGDKLFQLK